MPLFSIIVATRNRPTQFAEALRSIVNQSCTSKEVIVVNDGSDAYSLKMYEESVEEVGPYTHLYSLVHRPNGHGPSYTRNYGASVASGEYLCFLDDDDVWTDNEYLSRIQSGLMQLEAAPDLILSNQAAYLNGIRKNENIWLEGLADELRGDRTSFCLDELYRVNVKQLLHFGGLSHLNTMIVRRSLFEDAHGMDENIRWEEDRDLFLRLIDKAKYVVYSPKVVSRHNIPDPKSKSNITTSLDEMRRRQYQLYLFDKAIMHSKQQDIRAYARTQKGFILKHIAVLHAKRMDYINAAYYAKQAMVILPTSKWFLYVCYLAIKSL